MSISCTSNSKSDPFASPRRNSAMGAFLCAPLNRYRIRHVRVLLVAPCPPRGDGAFSSRSAFQAAFPPSAAAPAVSFLPDACHTDKDISLWGCSISSKSVDHLESCRASADPSCLFPFLPPSCSCLCLWAARTCHHATDASSWEDLENERTPLSMMW